MRHIIEQTILNAVTPVAITSSTDATPIVITATAHGLATGDRVLIIGHTTNIAANGIFKVTKLTANTFSLQDEFTGADVAGSGAGAGANTGFCMKAPNVLLASDYKTVVFTMITAGTATMNIKVASSDGKLQGDSTSPRFDYPNFAGTISKTNPYVYIQSINLDTGVAVDGATGHVVAGTDINKRFEVNSNGVKYLTVFPSTWTQGSISVKATCYYI